MSDIQKYGTETLNEEVDGGEHELRNVANSSFPDESVTQNSSAPIDCQRTNENSAQVGDNELNEEEKYKLKMEKYDTGKPLNIVSLRNVFYDLPEDYDKKDMRLKGIKTQGGHVHHMPNIWVQMKEKAKGEKKQKTVRTIDGRSTYFSQRDVPHRGLSEEEEEEEEDGSNEEENSGNQDGNSDDQENLEHRSKKVGFEEEGASESIAQSSINDTTVNESKKSMSINYLESQAGESPGTSMPANYHEAQEPISLSEAEKTLIEYDKEGVLPWWPWPRKGQKVFYPESWREKEDESIRDNPMSRYACGLWWWSYMICGADLDELDIPVKHRSDLCERFDWEWPPSQQLWTESLSTRHSVLSAYVVDHINILTILPFLGFHYVLKKLKEWDWEIPYVLFLCFNFFFIPSVFTIIIYGVIPLGNMLVCDLTNYGVWLFFTMPITCMVTELCLFTLLFACIDECCPWRPLWMISPCFVISYILKMIIFVPVVIYVGSFSMLNLVTLTICFVTVSLSMFLMKKPILLFADYKGFTWKEVKRIYGLFWADDKLLDPVKVERFNTFYKILFVYLVSFMVYSAYVLVIKFGSSAVQQVASLIIFFAEVAFRKFLQHMAAPYTRDMNFLLSGLYVYCVHSTFTVFSTPNIDSTGEQKYKNAFLTYAVLAVQPISDVFIAMFHQSELWFRFRNWIKKIPKPLLLCGETDPMTLGIEEDVDFEGRGTTNAHPDYRRAKVYFDLYVFLGSISGYASFLAISWVLYVGPNSERFPYNSDKELSLYGQENLPYSIQDFRTAVYYALFVVALLLVFVLVYSLYLKRFYPSISEVYKDTHYIFVKRPHMLGLAMIMCTMIILYVTGLLLTFNRVWYYDVGTTYGVCV